jgi:SAM-dependent methyltransferase
MAQHLAGMWDSWGGLTDIVETGENPRRRPGGERDDEGLNAFIGAMHVAGRGLAVEIAEDYDLSPYKKLLDIGGASGTYTIAFLRENPGMSSVLFDLPRVIPMAKERLTEEGLMDRVELVTGDFYEDRLPGGCDLALLSAIIHQNSPGENLELYKKIHRALAPGGALLIRDHVMDEDRLSPPSGAIFAINMLVHTKGGDTYTFSEIERSMEEAGFEEIQLVRKGPKMDCLVQGRKPA